MCMYVVLLFSEMLHFSQKDFCGNIFFSYEKLKSLMACLRMLIILKIRVKVAKLLQAKITTNHSYPPLPHPPKPPPSSLP